MKSKFLRLFGILACATLLAGWFAMPTDAGGRDCDTNAVIRCGTLTKDELNNALLNGATGPNQSVAELQNLFRMFGLERSDVSNLVDGTVTKSGNVIVNGRVVASNVKSIGRHFMPGSTQVPGVSYPLFMRPPSVSFIPDSLSAFVLMNPDGSMVMATIKSCGNIVPGVGKKVNHVLTIKKWEDKNGNRKIDPGEPFLPGWSFKLSGTINKTVTTGADGTVAVTVPASVFNVDEILQPGWVSTTGTHAIAHMTEADGKIFFGNKKIEEKKVKLKIIKFEDKDADKVLDGDEPLLPGWEFKIKGPNGFEKNVTTGSNGIVELVDLPAGTFTVTEMLKEGWQNITPLTQTLDIQSDTGVFQFGNKKVEVVVKKGAIKIVKFEDKDADKIKDGDEVGLSGWEFKVTGPNGFQKNVTTGENGTVSFNSLEPGSYKVTEILKSGWESTTGIEETKEVKADMLTVFEFGNKRVVVPVKKVQLKVIKFQDNNKDMIIEGDEPLLAGWQFKITGPMDFEQTVTTGANGIIELTNLEPGEYTVTEMLQEGWENTTPLTQKLNIQSNTGVFQFGNIRKVVPVIPIPAPIVTPAVTETPMSLPVTGPVETAGSAIAMFGLAGSLGNWIRSRKLLKKSAKK